MPTDFAETLNFKTVQVWSHLVSIVLIDNRILKTIWAKVSKVLLRVTTMSLTQIFDEID